MVLRVDKEKGYIDLSKRCEEASIPWRRIAAVRDPYKREGARERSDGRCLYCIRLDRRVATEDIQKCEERFNKSKMVRVHAGW